MTASHQDQVRDLYQSSASKYASMMDQEITQPLYSDVLSRLSQRLGSLSGSLIDTSCGSGHMLARYQDEFDPTRRVIGVDLSPAMVEIARAKLGDNAKVTEGNMLEQGSIIPGSAAGLISFFALHHLVPSEVPVALATWYRALQTGGQLVLAAWEGEGEIDYGEASDLVALKHPEASLIEWVKAAGFKVDRCTVETDESLGMPAVYLEATKR